MSSINNMITAIPSAGYSHLLRAQLNPRQSFSDVLDLGVSHLLYACDTPAIRDPNTSDAKNTTSEALLQLEILLPPAEIDEPALPSLSLANKKQTETLNVEVKNPLAGFVFKPATTTSSAPTPFLSGPSRMPPSVADVASLAVKMELVATENTVTKTANTISNTQPVKKHQLSLKPMRVGQKITPRIMKRTANH
ncbi:hypothetical protein F4604DRAFT_1976438 [Suillus subluteus]|nr:hypothetical protein F4604DRAFT_1976438 [Suillus subluteus]